MELLDSDFVVVLTTFPADHDVDRVARALVAERLAACVNILPPMTSIYSWKGALEKVDERQVVIKTRKGRVTGLEARLKELHPYDVPEFVVLPISAGSHAYLAWISENTSK